MRDEHAPYFAALEQHPRLLVGRKVPAIGREGEELLRDTNDAREWQDAVKQLLVAEVRDRAGRAMEESGDFLRTVHQSIELFQNNVDLIPGTKSFDVELANRFATLAAPYELRVDEKLHGYSIPVQPIVNQLREQLKAERAAKSAPAAPATTASPAAPAATPPAADPPQAGIQGKAGSGASTEDFSTLFGTIGLPNLQI